jgi:class 3 adenylate cyclase
MRCPACRHDNRPEARFCEACGVAFVASCPACTAGIVLGQRFCHACGAALGDGAPPGADAVGGDGGPAAPLLRGERKQVTVMFADLMGSLALIGVEDAERARDLLDGALRAMEAAVQRYGGFGCKSLGDGIMALFGAPVAQEDHATRACFAALALQRAVAAFGEARPSTTGAGVQARVELHSGEVVVRAIRVGLGLDYDAIGPTVHLASRIEQLAEASRVWLSRDTARLACEAVEVRALGARDIKGLQQPLEMFELTGVTTRTRLQAAERVGLAPFVGRAPDRARLDELRRSCASGKGWLVALSGEAGVGESRLAHELSRGAAAEGWSVLPAFASPLLQGAAWAPIVHLLHHHLGTDEREDRELLGRRVRERVSRLGGALLPSLTPLLALLDAPVGDERWRTLAAPQRHRLTVTALKSLVVRESQIQPVLLVFEDLQWLDAESLDFLSGLVDSLPTARVMLLVTYRTGHEHPWAHRTEYVPIRLGPLGSDSMHELWSHLAGDAPALRPARASTLERAQGNPLFLEGIIRRLVETGALLGERGHLEPARPLSASDIPPSLQALVAARVDRLAPDARRVLNAAAVIGDEIDLQILRSVAAAPESEFLAGLSALVASEFLYETRLFPDPGFTFRHALTRQVVYGTLLGGERRALHRRAAEAIEARTAHATASTRWSSRATTRRRSCGRRPASGSSPPPRRPSDATATRSRPRWRRTRLRLPLAARRRRDGRSRFWSFSGISRVFWGISRARTATTTVRWRSRRTRPGATGSATAGTSPAASSATAAASPGTPMAAARPRSCWSRLWSTASPCCSRSSSGSARSFAS